MTQSSRTNARAHGFALIEAVLAMVVVSVMLVAALRVVGASSLAQTSSADRLRGLGLAQDLMAEIASKAYADPSNPGTWGLSAAETTAGRISYDDVDDYNGLTESPPKDRAGADMPGWTGWKRTVAVTWVNLANPSLTAVAESGVKRTTITVSRNGKTVVQVVSLRTPAITR